MSCIDELNEVLRVGTAAFLNAWELKERRIEVQLYFLKDPSMETKLLKSLSKDEFTLKSNESLIVIKYYDNNSNPLFPTDLQISQVETNFFSGLSELKFAYRSFQSPGFKRHLLFTKQKGEEIVLNELKFAEFEKIQSWSGNFLSIGIISKNNIDFSFIIEMFKFWSVFHSHIKMCIRTLPLEFLEVYDILNLEDSARKLIEEILSPVLYSPVNFEQEAILYEIYESSHLIAEEETYYENEEYFMNLQNDEGYLTAFDKEFQIEKDLHSFDTVLVNDKTSLDLILGLHFLEENPERKMNYIFLSTFLNKVPLMDLNDDRLPYFHLLKQSKIMLEELSIKAFIKETKGFKFTNLEQSNFKKKKSLAQVIQMEAVHDIDIPFQIIILFNIQTSHLSLDDVLKDFFSYFSQIRQTISEVLEERIKILLTKANELGNPLTSRARRAEKMCNLYMPALVGSLTNILNDHRDLLLGSGLADEFPNTKSLLLYENEENIYKYLEQSLLKIMLDDKLTEEK